MSQHWEPGTAGDIVDYEGGSLSTQRPTHDGQPTNPRMPPKLEWYTRFMYDTYELGCNFAVLLFLGDVPEDPKNWKTCETFVDAAYTFINSSARKCGTCRKQRNFLEKGFVPLNHAIVERSGLSSLEPSVVVPYLKQALQWRVLKRDGTSAELKSLEVSVYCTPLSYPNGPLFPVAGEPCYYNDITHDRPGGCLDCA